MSNFVWQHTHSHSFEIEIYIFNSHNTSNSILWTICCIFFTFVSLHFSSIICFEITSNVRQCIFLEKPHSVLKKRENVPVWERHESEVNKNDTHTHTLIFHETKWKMKRKINKSTRAHNEYFCLFSKNGRINKTWRKKNWKQLMHSIHFNNFTYVPVF